MSKTDLAFLISWNLMRLRYFIIELIPSGVKHNEKTQLNSQGHIKK